MAKKGKPPARKKIEAHRHAEAKRRNIPTAEYQSVIQKEAEQPLRVAYERRNRDLDPQLVWRGKDQQDWIDLVVQAPPFYIQGKVHPKALGPRGFVSQIAFRKTAGQSSAGLAGTLDSLLHYARDIDRLKYRQLFVEKGLGGVGAGAAKRWRGRAEAC